jgi:hypothetical protein
LVTNEDKEEFNVIELQEKGGLGLHGDTGYPKIKRIFWG